MRKNKVLDFTKIILSILVILLHTLPVNNYTFWIGDGICRLAVPFFFFLSGYYSFNFFKERKTGKELIVFLSPYIVAFFVWMIAYAYYSYNKTFMLISFDNVFIYLGKIFYIFLYKEGYFHLWYVLATIYGFICLYILKRIRFSDRSIIIISVVCYVLGLISTTYSIFFQEYHGFITAIRYIGYPITFAFPLLSIGYVMHRYEPEVLFRFRKVMNLYIVIFLYCFEFVLVWIYCSGSKFFDMYLMHLVLIPLLFMKLKDCTQIQIDKIPSRYISCSGEIYFLHPLIISLVAFMGVKSLTIGVLLIIIITYLLSLIIHPYLYRLYRIFR